MIKQSFSIHSAEKQVKCRGRFACGFTLIELLVVISIIALLLSILVPTLSRVKEQAKRVVCMTRVKGMVTAIFMYSDDWNNCMPTWDHPSRPELGWEVAAQQQLGYLTSKVGLGKLYPTYIDEGKLYFCPSARHTTFDKCYYDNSSDTWDDFYYGMNSPTVTSSTNGTYHLRGDIKENDLTSTRYVKTLINHPNRMILTDTAIYWNAFSGTDVEIIFKVSQLVNHLNSKGQPAYYNCGWADGSVSAYRVHNPDDFLGDSWTYNTVSQNRGATVMDVMARDEW